VGVPRVTPEQWKELSPITKWLIATRAGVLIMTFISSSIAGIFAYEASRFDFWIWFCVTIGLLLAHATNNLLNDFTDWSKGVDKDNYFRNQYGTHPMTVMTKKEMIAYIVITGLAALSCGIYLILLRGEIVLYLTLAGAFFLLFYTYPLKFIGMGEISVFIVWGLLMVGGGYYTITKEWSWNVCWASIPYSLGVTSVIFGKHIDKADLDLKKGIYTLPVILGDSLSRISVLTMLATMYISVFYLIFNEFFGPILLLVLLALPRFLKVARVYLKPRPKEAPKDYPKNVWPLYFVAYAFDHNRIFGSLFLIGLLLDALYFSQ